ncbi:MAG TPA: dTDP-4-dehydrorhamnose 3,5-epimerase [Puia sp.]
MIFIPLPFQGAYIIEPEVYQDERGSFYRFFCEDEFKQIGHNKPWIQINHSHTKSKGTLRGLHFQLPPYSEIKMVKCIAGKILDVIIDLRNGSSTFLQWTGVEISAENRRMMYIPEGFAHGFQTLTDDCEMIYHHSASYVKDSEGGIRWDDPMINIKWSLPPIHVSTRDQEFPLINRQFQGIKL